MRFTQDQHILKIHHNGLQHKSGSSPVMQKQVWADTDATEETHVKAS